MAERIDVDTSMMEAYAAVRTIVRRDRGEICRLMLQRMAEKSGIATPTTDDLIRLDREREGSNVDWTSPIDPDARIAKMKDGTTHLAYKPEHAVDHNTGAIVAAEASLRGLGRAPSAEAPAEGVAYKGYRSREVLKDLDGGGWKSRIAKKRRPEVCRWRADHAARRAVYNNRTRMLSAVTKVTFKLRAELCERSFALVLDCGGMRRSWLRGRANVHMRYLLHVARSSLGLIMRLLVEVNCHAS